MNALISLISRHQVAAALPLNPEDEAQSRGIMAGALAASHELLTPSEFERLVAACEIDPPTLAQLLALTSDPADPSDPSDTTIEA